MEEVSEILFEEISSNSDEEVADIMDASRKSALALHGGNGFKPANVIMAEEVDVLKVTKNFGDDFHCWNLSFHIPPVVFKFWKETVNETS